MYRYIALVWNVLDTSKQQTVGSYASRLTNLGWQAVMHAPGIKVFQIGFLRTSSDCLALSHGAGVVLGTLFKNAESARAFSSKAQLDDAESARVIDTQGHHLLNNYWGRYVAVLHDSENAVVSILRDPSGALPCLMANCRGVDIFFSDAESIAQLVVGPFSINWDYVYGVVCSSALQLRATGLREISEVQAGERVDLQHGCLTRTLIWNALRISQSDPIESPEQAARAVGHVTRDCVYAFAAGHEHILHRLSGGLDSSIVARCLSDAPTRPSVVCLNYFGEGAHEDERVFARAVAQSTGLRLIERRNNPLGTNLDSLLNISRTERPRFLIYNVEHSELEARIAEDFGATALFGGTGGDGLFYQTNAVLGAIDYLYTYGTTPRLLRIALDAARMDRVSIWAVLRRAIGEAMFDRRWDPTEELGVGRQFVSAEIANVVRGNKAFSHPWLSESAGVPHGKLWHAMGVSTPLPFYDPLGREGNPESIYPLISQPLLELCMRIPVYALIDGGWDRSTARKAFSNSLPSKIVRRRGKGGSTRSAKVLYQNNLPFIREFMLDGVLVRERILDRKKLEAELNTSRAVTSAAFSEILIEHLCTEAWLRSWSREVDVASAA